jgi:hypothetical protein
MTDTKRERIAKQLLGIVSDIWCSRESDVEPYFNCLICEFKDGPEYRLHQFINSTKYETEYPQGMIKGGEDQ